MTAIICIALLLGGFAWQPLWLCLVVYIIWRAGRHRRSDLILNHLEKMVLGRRMRADVRDLNFEAAQAFAQDNGGRIFPEDRDAISCTTVICGEPYSITFMRERRIGGTHIRITDHISFDGSSVENLRKSEETFLKLLEDSTRQ